MTPLFLSLVLLVAVALADSATGVLRALARRPRPRSRP